MARYSHVFLETAIETTRYTASRGRSKDFNLPARERGAHAARLRTALGTAQAARRQFPVQVGNGFYQSPGLMLTFESEPDFPLAFESLELTRSGIQLLSVATDADNRTIATVLVPDDKIARFVKIIEAYQRAAVGKRDNKKLVESISNIKLATLRELWTDDPATYPAAGVEFVWEVWLRGADNALALLRSASEHLGYRIITNALTFIDRTVVLVRATPEQLSLGAEILGIIAEVRKAKTMADLYVARDAAQQAADITAVAARILPIPPGSPVVGLLDTGVNRGHPLLAPVIADADLHSFKPAWGVNDGHSTGHGTQMAGLAIFGNLTDLLSSEGPIPVTHGVQSLKFFNAADQHEVELYGVVTIEGISRLEVDLARKKVFCMAVTSIDGLDRGRPSSWSAALDELAFGNINDTARLILVSAGNTDLDDRGDYPASNETAPVQDPAQSWNALTVGGYTNLAFINQEISPGWQPLAQPGDLAPGSSTSLTWPRSNKTPFKPDIVMEAGNMGLPPDDAVGVYFLPELQLLSTSRNFGLGRPHLSEFCDTSAATALAARLSARLMSRYPNYRPETVRGFLVHSARWTEAMLGRVRHSDGTLDTNRLLRTFGWGTPDVEALMYSAQNNLTLVAESELQPFFDDGGTIKSKDINYHELPWPKEALEALPFDTPIEMRVTLSYFIEPSPGERGWDRRYGYPSHGLRFHVIRPAETLEQFKLRINTYDRDDEYDEDHVGETGRWELGTGKPRNGSIHSNTWHGSAAELAGRGCIAVYPTIGWWRTRKKEQRYKRKVCYSLIVSIYTPNQEIDIYTPVAIDVGIDVSV
jgi:hypothetical protein